METATTNGHKVVVNLSTGHEDADRVTVAFLVGTAALAAGKQVIMFLTKEAVRLALPGYADAVEVPGAPPGRAVVPAVRRQPRPTLRLPGLLQRPANSMIKRSSDNARLAGATPLWEWIGDGATVFSY